MSRLKDYDRLHKQYMIKCNGTKTVHTAMNSVSKEHHPLYELRISSLAEDIPEESKVKLSP
jgi:hypothetical protein